MQTSSLSALRFLLLLWGIVCFLLPAHQTHFNELFLFSCLPAIKSFPLPQNVRAQGSLAWQLCLLIGIHRWQVCAGPLTLTTPDVVGSPESIQLNTRSRSILSYLIVGCGGCLGRRGQGLGEAEANEVSGMRSISERPRPPHPSHSSGRQKGV